MSSTVPEQPATASSDLGNNSIGMTPDMEPNNLANAKRNTVFILPAFILKGDAYN